MKIIIRQSENNIILDLPYGEILKLLEIFKQDKSNHCKTISVISYKVNKEDVEFIRELQCHYNTHMECQIYTP